MGKAAADHVATIIRNLHSRQKHVNMIFAAAPSQNEFLAHLTSMKGLDWSGVIGFQMDEYIGLPGESDQLFSKYLMDHLFSKVQMKEVHILDAVAKNPIKECARYAELLKSHPIDIVCLGIGENGHIAFNDPPVADFDDPFPVKVVELDEPCRQQQVNDGCFASFPEVPTEAITLTVPQLMSARYLSIVVPSERKAIAVHNALIGPVTTKVPASILRQHAQAMMFIDELAAAQL
jgi:glucosamine-6-phosphate deaminase